MRLKPDAVCKIAHCNPPRLCVPKRYTIEGRARQRIRPLRADSTKRLVSLEDLPHSTKAGRSTKRLLSDVRQFAKDLVAAVDFFPGEGLQTFGAETFDGK